MGKRVSVVLLLMMPGSVVGEFMKFVLAVEKKRVPIQTMSKLRPSSTSTRPAKDLYLHYHCRLYRLIFFHEEDYKLVHLVS